MKGYNVVNTIEVDAYLDDEMQPTCTTDFITGRFCTFLRTAKFGLVDTCVFLSDKEELFRRDGGNGSLIPCNKCLVWSSNNVDGE